MSFLHVVGYQNTIIEYIHTYRQTDRQTDKYLMACQHMSDALLFCFFDDVYFFWSDK